MTVDEVVEKVEKDMIFYNTSGGGVTLSGGEVLGQSEFALELLKKLKELSINTAMETSGFGHSKSLLELSKYLDLILFDLKIMDEKISKDILGTDSSLIKNNLRMLVASNSKVIPRIPLIPGYTMDDKNIHDIIQVVKELGLKEVHILPFHQYGSKKYEYLNKQYALKDIDVLAETKVNNIKTKMEIEGLKVVIGGM
jgi:pyruvate formate lyase activating enzyme